MTDTRSWNRKYRPVQVADLHLDHVRSELTRFLAAGMVPQVLLFAGPKGTGKTSASRILGAVLNDSANEKAVQSAYLQSGKKIPLQEPDPTSSTTQKIIDGNSFIVTELDAASNRGIDDVRLLRERVQLPPQGANIAVYILDEVHMLTTEAFNALLKLLEEPPRHVLFILATTELHKLPGTIISRCHVVTFAKAREDELIAALKKILAAEHISYDDAALAAIAEHADGSFRDAVKVLESFKNEQSISSAVVEKRLQAASQSQLSGLLTAILQKDPAEVSTYFQTFRSQGVSGKHIHKQLLDILHTSLLQSLGVVTGTALTTTPAAHFLLSQLSRSELSEPSPIPLLPLEMKILEIVFKAQQQGGGKPSKQSKKATPESETIVEKETAATPQKEVVASTATHNSVLSSEQGDGKVLCEKWSEFVTAVSTQNSTLAAILQSAQPLEGTLGSARVHVFYKFHKDQLSLPKFKHVTALCSSQIAGGNLELEFILSESTATLDTTTGQSVPELGKLAADTLM